MSLQFGRVAYAQKSHILHQEQWRSDLNKPIFVSSKTTHSTQFIYSETHIRTAGKKDANHARFKITPYLTILSAANKIVTIN